MTPETQTVLLAVLASGALTAVIQGLLNRHKTKADAAEVSTGVFNAAIKQLENENHQLRREINQLRKALTNAGIPIPITTPNQT